MVTENSDVTGTFINEDKGINAKSTFGLDIFKDKKTGASFLGKKVGDVVTIKTKGLFEDDHMLMDYLKVSHDDVHGLDVDVTFTIEAINGTDLAELNQALFDGISKETLQLVFIPNEFPYNLANGSHWTLWYNTSTQPYSNDRITEDISVKLRGCQGDDKEVDFGWCVVVINFLHLCVVSMECDCAVIQA